jgi:hypothetical protein
MKIVYRKVLKIKVISAIVMVSIILKWLYFLYCQADQQLDLAVDRKRSCF